jgi:hypothetical protein
LELWVVTFSIICSSFGGRRFRCCFGAIVIFYYINPFF